MKASLFSAIFLLIYCVSPSVHSEAIDFGLGLELELLKAKDKDPFNHFLGPLIKQEGENLSIKVCLSWKNGHAAGFQEIGYSDEVQERYSRVLVPYKIEGVRSNLFYIARSRDDFCVLATKNYIMTKDKTHDFVQSYVKLNMDLLRKQMNQQFDTLTASINGLSVNDLRNEIYKDLKQETIRELTQGNGYKKMKADITREVIQQLRLDGYISE